MASKKVLQNRINKLVDKMKEDILFYPNLEITDAQYWNDESPILTVSTDYQIIMFSVEDFENIITKTRMRRGAGSEKDFNKKIEYIGILRKYAKKHYKNESFKIAESLDNIKVTTDLEIHTLTVNPKTLEIEVKIRARRGTKNKQEIPVEEPKTFTEPITKLPSDEVNKMGTVVLDEVIPSQEKTKRHRRTKAEMEAARAKESVQAPVQISNRQSNLVSEKESADDLKGVDFREREYPLISEGTVVVNICSNKSYKVTKSSKSNIVEVFDKDHGYLIMARADIKCS